MPPLKPLPKQVKTSIREFRGDYRFLSNFYPAETYIAFEGGVYPTVEHAYQAAKTLDKLAREPFQVSGSGSECKYITPGQAKRLGRTIHIRPDWEEVKLLVMETLLFKKFQDQLLRARLLETGTMELVEGNNWNDTFWGVDLRSGIGENKLGKLLMKVREHYEQQAKAPS